jgi:hypothetical protein
MPQPTDSLKGHCPRCGPDRISDIIKEHHVDYADDDSNTWGYINYRILGCRGCASIYFQTSEYHSEEGGEIKPTISHWPIPQKRRKPDWTFMFLLLNADDCYELFEELYAAFNSGHNILAAIGVRTAFDRASELLGAAPEKTFGEKIKYLASKGFIGAEEEKALGVLVQAGNAITHRRWSADAKGLELLISILENLIHRNLIVKQEVRQLESRIPPKIRRGPN